MVERQNTNNAIPSNELADLNDNTIIIDEFTNSKEEYTKDRLGRKFRTLFKYTADIEAAIASAQSGSYLPMTGGMISGNLNVTGNLQKSGANVITTTGGTISGTLNVTTQLQENGQRVYSPNNKPSATVVGALPATGGTISGNLNVTGNLQKSGANVLTMANFNQNLSETGFSKLPNGLIIQWGSFNANSTSFLVTLPISFPVLCIAALASPMTSSNINVDPTSSYIGHYAEKEKIRFLTRNYTGANTGKYQWIAIGY